MKAPASGLSKEAVRALTRELDPGRFRFCVWRNVSLTIWSAQGTLEAAERILRVSRELNHEFPQGRSQIMFICSGAPAPEQAASELLTEVYNPKLSGIVCIAAVLEGSGFWASGIRSRMTSMRIAGGNAMALRTQETIDEVITWLPQEHAERTGVILAPTELKSVLLTVRALGTYDE
jgi:hypothetical protein